MISEGLMTHSDCVCKLPGSLTAHNIYQLVQAVIVNLEMIAGSKCIFKDMLSSAQVIRSILNVLSDTLLSSTKALIHKPDAATVFLKLSYTTAGLRYLVREIHCSE